MGDSSEREGVPRPRFVLSLIKAYDYLPKPGVCAMEDHVGLGMDVQWIESSLEACVDRQLVVSCWRCVERNLEYAERLHFDCESPLTLSLYGSEGRNLLGFEPNEDWELKRPKSSPPPDPVALRYSKVSDSSLSRLST